MGNLPCCQRSQFSLFAILPLPLLLPPPLPTPQTTKISRTRRQENQRIKEGRGKYTRSQCCYKRSSTGRFYFFHSWFFRRYPPSLSLTLALSHNGQHPLLDSHISDEGQLRRKGGRRNEGGEKFSVWEKKQQHPKQQSEKKGTSFFIFFSDSFWGLSLPLSLRLLYQLTRWELEHMERSGRW